MASLFDNCGLICQLIYIYIYTHIYKQGPHLGKYEVLPCGALNK